MRPVTTKEAFTIGLTLSLTLLGACQSMERSTESGYQDRSTQQTRSGWNPSTKTSTAETAAPNSDLNDRMRLKQLETQLSTRRELEQYSKALPLFSDIREKISFLSAGGFSERQTWLNQNEFSSRASKIQKELGPIAEAQDIAVGMPENLVRKAWGEPSAIEVAGLPEFRNQKWRYGKFVSSQDGFRPEQKIVYFESGKVVGWEVK